MVDQSEARIDSAAKIRVMIVTKPCAQCQVVSDGELILCVQSPDHRTCRVGHKDVADRGEIALILLQVVRDLRAERNLMPLEERAVQLYFGIPPRAGERICVD